MTATMPFPCWAADTRRKFIGILSIVMVTTAACVTTQAENVAIVVGIGHYRYLPEATLQGIDHDVERMVAVYQSRGFTKILRLFDQTAGKANIQEAFEMARQSVRSGDRFAYYQSSHGAPDHHLLTYDTTRDGDNAISVEELKAWIASIPTANKTLVLDACFSGGFKGRGGQKGEVKFFPLQSYQDQPVRVLRQDLERENTAYAGGDYVFFGSSQPDEPSLVLDLNGQKSSVFTYYLAAELNREQASAWNGVVQPTIHAVVQTTDGRQTPIFNSRYLTFAVFGDADNGGPDTIAPIRNLGQLYDIQNEATSVLHLKGIMGCTPDSLNRYLPDTRVILHLTVNRPGYLFMINRDDRDGAQLVGWDKTDLDTSSVEAMLDGSQIKEPTGEFEFGKGTLQITTKARDGFERWKAFLFTDREQARQFVEKWRELLLDSTKQIPRGSLTEKKLASRTGVSTQTLYTAEITYQVTAHGSPANPADNEDLDKGHPK